MTTYGSLCSGAEMLGLAAEAVLGPLTHLWHAEVDPAASKVLAARFPGVPNLGDISTIDWSRQPHVDILTAGFPCQDASHAGKRAGLAEGTRTGLWKHVARCIDAIRPKLVLLENVEGIHSARAHSDLERCPWCVGDDPTAVLLRASGAVLGDLAGLGYDGRWVTVAASDIGAPHRRRRVFFVAYPADTESLGRWLTGPPRGRGIPSTAVAGAAGSGLTLLPTPAAADGERASLTYVRGNPTLVGALLPTPSAGQFNDSENLESWQARRAECAERHGNNGFGVPLGVAVRLLRQSRAAGALRSNIMDRNARPLNEVVTNLLPTPTAALGRGTGMPSEETATRRRDEEGRRFLDDAVALLPTPVTADARGTRNATAGRTAIKPTTNLGWTLSDIAFTDRWGEYAPAIARWEQILGRPAPEPTEPGTKGQPRLAARFVEWLMGLPDGWVCDVPGITRNDMLRILGNGVVPAQAAYAYRYLLSLPMVKQSDLFNGGTP